MFHYYPLNPRGEPEKKTCSTSWLNIHSICQNRPFMTKRRVNQREPNFSGREEQCRGTDPISTLERQLA